MKVNNILHISPTDIRYDGRILKEIKSLFRLDGIHLRAFGINDDEGRNHCVEKLNYIRTFNLFAKKLKYLPRPLRYALIFFESMFFMAPPAIRYRPNIIHCHDTLFLPMALFIKFFCKSILIYDAHELESEKAGQSKILSKCTLLIEKACWNKIDLLISVSPSIIQWYISNLGYKKNELILNSPEYLVTNNAGFKSQYLREKYNIPRNEKIYVYLGILSKYGRGIELYLEVFKSNDITSHLVFIGYGDLTDDIISTSNSYLNIHYHPAVSHDQVVEIARSADVGLCMIDPVSLSDRFSLPNKLFEYAFSNLYVLASDLPDIKSIIDEFNLGMYCRNEIDDLRNSIGWINKNGCLVRPLVSESIYHLSWLYQEEKLLKLYKNIL